MSKKEKILKRFLKKPNDFTYKELVALLKGFDYFELASGKTSGSRIAFFNKQFSHIIRIHKPHPGNILKFYQIEQIIEELKKIGVIQ